MKRLVYSPKVYVFVKADDGIHDLTPHVIDCSVTRKVNQVSSASVTFRNPNRIFTNGKNGAVFHPMDPIVIFMKRLDNRPVQVFTGYCDSTPYFQLKPAPATITASCTLKRLLYTYWDPGLPFVQEVLAQRGWNAIGAQGGLGIANLNPNDDPGNDDDDDNGNNNNNNLPEVSDGSIGALLFDILLYIGNWDPSTIFIEPIPENVYEVAESLIAEMNDANKDARKEFNKLLKYIIGEDGYGAGDPSANPNGPVGQDIQDFAGPNPDSLLKGRVSWFNDGITASGISAATNAGVALNLLPGTTERGWNNEVTQQWMTWAREGRPMIVRVTSQGRSATMPIIDVGPNQSTNRAIDITTTGVYKMGFRNISDFKTDAEGTVEFLGRRNDRS